MKRRFNISAAQMVLLSVLGAVVASGGFILLAFDRQIVHRDSLAFIPSLILSLLLVVAGFGISLMAESSLTNGIAAERWPEDKIAALRRLVQSSFWKGLSIFCVIAYVGSFIALTRPYRPLVWVGFIFSMMIFRLRAAVIPFPSPGPPKVIDWSNNATPLRSEHWGEH